MLTDYAGVLIFLTVGTLFILVSLTLARIFRANDPTPEKLTPYECGEEPEGGAWIQFNIRFYIIALIFIIFDVEIVFLFPWAVVYKSLGFFALVEMMIFVSILLVGLAYVWKKGDLEWVKPQSPYGNK